MSLHDGDLSVHKDDKSTFRRRIRDSVGDDHFRDLDRSTDDSVAIQVNGDLVDLLIDTDYYKSRLSILALRPAPIQVDPSKSKGNVCVD
eukprot:117628-Hanusia_phi.AAC.2